MYSIEYNSNIYTIIHCRFTIKVSYYIRFQYFNTVGNYTISY